MQLPVTRIDKSLPLPKYETAGAVAFDLYARETVVIEPQTIALIPTNLIVQIPPGYALIIAARSSTPKKKGLSVPHGIGIIDQDYRGPKDELLAQLFNYTDVMVTVERGERIAQALIVPIARIELVEHELATAKNRGGFGSTG
ncbi:dUTP diphosphatase [Patescibacteria group bacterium]|nr:dUTP diphosphatase [Patescibacteria group bacterium]MBU1029096.1 dUTP diphosphatase [Patescibacteria group bacterium]MBU1916172.1 dUTP diphosphatase [Patescibacteria group bacterium]